MNRNKAMYSDLTKAEYALIHYRCAALQGLLNNPEGLPQNDVVLLANEIAKAMLGLPDD